MADSNSLGNVTHNRKNNRVEDTVIIIVIEDQPYETLDWSFGGFRVGGYEGNIHGDTAFLVKGIGPDLENIFDVRVDCQAVRVNENQLSASFVDIESDVYDILEALMQRREKSLVKLKKQLPYSSLADRYLELAEENIRKIYDTFLKLEAATGDRKQELKGVHQAAINIKDQGLILDYELMTAICTELCLLIEKLDKVGPKEVEVIKIYIEAMKLVLHKNITGTGGDVGEEVLSGLRRVCDKFNL